MKKNITIYILLTILLLFSFKPEVNATLTKKDTDAHCEDVIEKHKDLFDNGNVLFNAKDYETNCVYTQNYDELANRTKNICVVFQLAYNREDGTYKIEHLGRKDKDPEITFSSQDYFKEVNGICPRNIFYKHNAGSAETFLLESEKTWYNSETIMKRQYTRTPEIQVDSLIKPITDQGTRTCEDILGDGLVSVIQKIYNLVKIAIPLILFALGSLDMVQAIFSGSEDKMKKAQGKLMKRVMIAVVIFLIPTIVGFILNIAHNIWPEVDSSLCGIKL